MTQADIREASGKLKELIERARAGDEVVIAEDGKPVVRLVRIDDSPRLKGLGSYRNQIWIADDFDAPLSDAELKEWGV